MYNVEEEGMEEGMEEGGVLAAGPQLILDPNSQAIVTIDSGLDGGVPTRWVRLGKSGGIDEMSSPFPLDTEYEEEDQKARGERIDEFVSKMAEKYKTWSVFHELSHVEVAIDREISLRLQAELEEESWALNVIGVVVPLGRSDLLHRLDGTMVFQEMMDGLCEDVAAEIQSKFDAIEEMRAWLGV